MRNAVSEYGVGPYARWYRIQAACAGLAAIALAVALGHPSHVVTLLAVFGAARIAIGWFPTDTLAAGRRTRRGGVHALLAFVAFAAISAAAIRLQSNEHGAPWLGWIVAAFAAGTTVSLRSASLRPWFGLVERSFYVAMLAWLTLNSARLV